MKYAELVKQGSVKIFKAGMNDAAIDAWILMEHICKISRTDYFVKMHEQVPEEDVTAYFAAIDKRLEHYPVQYIVGEWEFMGLKFKVDENVLIPRQDTEILVVRILNLLEECYRKTEGPVRILDMCTGSGCIGISLAKLFDKSEVVGVDISVPALEIARENAEINEVKNIEFVASDLFENLHRIMGSEKFDIIVSNPPYIRSDEIPKLMPEVRDHEPKLALDGSFDGLEFYNKIIDNARNFIKKEGYLAFEIGYDQADDVMGLMRPGYSEVQLIKDLAGKDRVVVGKKK